MMTIADTFLELRSDERGGFIEVQLQSSRKSLLSKGTGLYQAMYYDVLSKLLLDKSKYLVEEKLVVLSR